MNCKEIEEELTALVDNETTVFRKLILRIHLFHCNSCHKFVKIEASLKRLVRSRATSAAAPGELRKKIAEDLKDTAS